MSSDAKSGKKSNIRFTQTGLRVLEKRYLRRDEKGNVAETPEEMFHRVARVVAGAEIIYDPGADTTLWEEEFYDVMSKLEFLPNSPVLLNAGLGSGQMAACFVLPVNDSIEAIFETVKHTAFIHKSGGGTGFSFSRVRPENDSAGGKRGVTRGTASLISVFSAAADYIKQGGVRRGCNSVILDITHPDIMDFIVAKDNPNALTNFYISVVVTNAFMEAVKAGEDYDLINPRHGQVVARLNAREVFDRVVEQAWKTGDPGLVFIDTINRDNPTPHLGRIENISGCGEQTLLPYESCTLGSINLTRMLRPAGNVFEIDFTKLARVTRTAVRFLDNIIDINNFPLPEIEEKTKTTRKIGLGVMGFADVLILMGIPYDSKEALVQAEKIMCCVNEEAHKASSELGQQRGSFPAFMGSVHDVPGGRPMRNASCTTIAPTGTLSLIAGCSSGIEPSFAMVFVRNILDGECLLEINPYFEETAKREGFHSKELLERLVTSNKLNTFKTIPEKIKKLFITAHKVTPEWHVKVQAAFQKYTDNAVSKTVNFPKSATRQDMAGVFMMAHKAGLKGITVYRDDSRMLQPLSTGEVGVKLVNEYLARKNVD
jgi:ribonucleoside-diphosphate reductase alpha chain